MTSKTTFTVLLTTVLVFCASFTAHGIDSPRFRGPDGSGVFAESGLLKSWPESGPERIFKVTGLGESYASIAVADGRLFTTGKHGDRGTVFAFDLEGQPLWKKEYGSVHDGSGYPGTRTTPTVDGDTLYLLSSMGKALALDVADGAIRWEVDLLEKFKGSNIYFGISESPLVDGSRVIFTPGGEGAALVALDKKTGKTLWTTRDLSDSAAYCNPRIFEHGSHRQIVTLVQKHLVGVDPETGEVLWREPSEVNYDIHATSPVFHQGSIYITHGYGQGGAMYTLAKDGRSVSLKWKEPSLDVHHGGAVVVGGHIYGAASNKTWSMLDVETGEVKASIKRLGKGAMVYADGLLYGYMESGDVLLVNPAPESFEVISSFEITEGESQHWSHPVISDGVLYLRHGEVLMAFDIAAKAAVGADTEAAAPAEG